MRSVTVAGVEEEAGVDEGAPVVVVAGEVGETDEDGPTMTCM